MTFPVVPADVDARIDRASKQNPPAAPIACDSCGAVAGARCITTAGHFAPTVHACRQRAVRLYLEAQEAGVTPVGDIEAARARRKRRARLAGQAGISTPVT